MGPDIKITLRLDGDNTVVKGIERVGASSESALKSISRWKDSVADFAHVGQSILLVKGSFDSVVGSVTGVASSMITAQQTVQKLRNTLEYSSGSAGGAVAEMAYLREMTRSLGLDFNSASTAYAKFSAATKGSGVTAEQTRSVFEGIAAASTRMGLSAEETSGALLALSQMASKGTVNAEELRGQLGERLPGAFNIAAKAMGVTTAELGKMMETGQLMASDFLPKFGAALKAEFEAPMNSLTQELNRFGSSWELWKQSFSEGANSTGFAWLTNGLNESAAAMRSLGKEANILQKIFAGAGGFELGAFGVNKFDTVKLQEQAFQKLSETKVLRKQLEDQQQKYGSLPPITQDRLDSLRSQEAAIRDSINELAIQRGKETGLKLPDLAGEYAAQLAKQDARLKTYLSDMSNAPKSAKLAADIDKENTAFKAAVGDLSETDSRYISVLAAHNARVAEIKKKSAGSSKEKDPELDALIARSENEQRNRKQLEDEYDKIQKINEKSARADQIVANYDKQSSLMIERIARQNELIGVSEREVLVKQALYKIEDEAQQVRDRIMQQIKDETEWKKALAEVEGGLAEKKLLVAEATRKSYDESRTFETGWKDAFSKYQDSASNAADTARTAFSGMTGAMENALKTFVKSGKIDFRSFGDSVINTLIDIQMQSLKTNVLAPMMESAGGWLSKLFSGGSYGGLDTGAGSGFDSALWGLASAKGNVFDTPGLSAYSSQVVSRPTVFPFARGVGLMGEAGPEAIMPLQRDSSGRLGVSGGGSNVTVIVNNHASGTQATQTERSDGSGGRIIEVMVEQVESKIANNVARGGGTLSPVLERTYGLGRMAGAY